MALTVKRYFILDRSGSMSNMLDDTIGGFNAFIDSQKAVGGTLSLYLFDNEFEVVYEDQPISTVEPLTKTTFIPRGGTALHDAIGNVISRVSLETHAPDTLIKFIIMTDGFENSSNKYTSKHIKDLIDIHTKKSGWDFMYIGANQDSILEAGKLGICAEHTLDFDRESVQQVMRSVSHTLSQQSLGNPVSLRQCSLQLPSHRLT